ncbi:MAG: hypothetical protein EOP49_36195 [Sphingobacteriales bacterium]|nr:MAG: hypothetical protein EOP49_36195 [Sphingobacteriales bacterium]
MRFSCSLLAIIMLVLSCIPCSDAKAMAVEETSLSSTAPLNTEHQQATDEEHTDDCSPFCQCACCAFLYVMPLPAASATAARPLDADKVFASFLQKQPVSIAIPVWQPPQL